MPLDQLSAYEWLVKLQADGWVFNFVVTRNDRRYASKHPFRIEDDDHGPCEKVCWLVPDELGKSSLLYFRCLVTALEHGKDVPHLKDTKTYLAILGEDREDHKTKQPRRKAYKIEDGWDQEELQEQRPAKRRRRRLLPLAKGLGQ